MTRTAALRTLIAILILASVPLYLVLTRPAKLRPAAPAIEALIRTIPGASQALRFEGKGFATGKQGLSDRSPAAGQKPAEVIEAQIPTRAAERFVLGNARSQSGVVVKLPGAAPAKLELESGRGVYRSVYPGVDVVATRDPHYFDISFVVNDPKAAPPLALDVRGAVPGTKLSLEPGSGAVLVRRDQVAPIARIDTPVAFDAEGRTRRGRYEIAGSTVRLLLDVSSMTAPVVIDPKFFIPLWTLLSDDRAPGAVSYPSAPTSREGHLAFDESLGKVILIRPVRSQQPEDSATSFAELARAQLGWYGWPSSAPISATSATAIAPALQPGAAEQADWKRTHGVQSETWQWNVGRWELLPATGLPGLIDPSVAFDRSRQKLVVAGGAPPGPFCEHRLLPFGADLKTVLCWPVAVTPVHEFSNGTWTARPIAGAPPQRVRAATASTAQHLILFGGRSLSAQETARVVDPYGPPYPESLATTLQNDTWRFDGSRWQRIPTANPPSPREGATLVLDERRGILVLVGGAKADGQDSFDLWEFDGVDWVERLSVGDSTLPVSLRGRTGISAVWNPVRQTTLLFGGIASRLDSCTLTDSEIQARRVNEFDALSRSGCLGGYVHDSWEWDGQSLRQLTRVAYGGRVRGMNLFRQIQEAGSGWGGSSPSPNGVVLGRGDTPLLPWRYDTDPEHFRLRSVLDRAHAAASAKAPIITVRADAVVPAGGAAPGANPVFVSPLFASSTRPDLVFDRARNLAVVVGPNDGRVFETSGSAWTEQTPAATPFATGQQDFFGATWDGVGQRIVLFDPRTAKTWVHQDGGSWTLLSPAASPPAWSVDPEVRRVRDIDMYRPRQTDNDSHVTEQLKRFVDVAKRAPQMTFDRARNRAVMLYGGSLWEFDGSTWSARALLPGWANCPAATLLGYDDARARVIAVGCKLPGETAEWNGSVWSGPFPGPYTAQIERDPFPNLNLTGDYWRRYYWKGTLQLPWAHPASLFSSSSLGGVSTFDSDGTLRTWSGTAWSTGPKMAEGHYCDWSNPATQAKRFLTEGGSPGNSRFFLAKGFDFAPLCFFPPALEDAAHQRILVFRDSAQGIRQLPLDVPANQRSWRELELGQTFSEDGQRVHPHPFELLSAEHVVVSAMSDPLARVAKYPPPLTPPFDITQDSARVPESLVNNLYWPFRPFVDPTSHRIRILTHRGAVWELGAEGRQGLGETCTGNADCLAGVCTAEKVCCYEDCSGACKTCKGSNPGFCTVVQAGSPNPLNRCGSGECAGACSGEVRPVGGLVLSSCAFDATKSCGAAASCTDGMLTAAGHCASDQPRCLQPTSSAAMPCPGGVGCANATTCRTGCTSRADCGPFKVCSANGSSCVPDRASTVSGELGIAALTWKAPRRRTAQELRAMLRDAGVPEDDEGAFFLPLPAYGGVRLGYDPDLKSPAMGLRACLQRIQACVGEAHSFDECVAAAPRCTSATPWLDDPAGEDCCPEACLVKYLERRRSGGVRQAFHEFFTGCYPGEGTTGGGP